MTRLRVGMILVAATLVLVAGRYAPSHSVAQQPRPSATPSTVGTPTVLPTPVVTSPPPPRPTRTISTPLPAITPRPTGSPTSQTTPTPVATKTATPFPITGRLKWHGGAPTDATEYIVVFWLPSGHAFDPQSTSAVFERDQLTLVRDIADAALNAFLDQYFRNPLPSSAAVVKQVVTSPLPYLGTQSDPIHDSDIVSMLNALRERQHLPVGLHTHYVVYLPYGVWTCLSNGPRCDANSDWDGYHSWEDSSGGNMVYAVMSDLSEMEDEIAQSPHHDPLADVVAMVSIHEIMEMETDGVGNGWYGNGTETEVADLCQTVRSIVHPLGPGPSWEVPLAWSDRRGMCVEPTDA